MSQYMSDKECRFRNAKSPEARMRACFSEATYDWADDMNKELKGFPFVRYAYPHEINKEHHLEC